MEIIQATERIPDMKHVWEIRYVPLIEKSK